MVIPTTALYAFIEQNSEVPLARTADTNELIKIRQSDWIALNEPVLINGNTYKIANIVIEPFIRQSQFMPEYEYDLGRGAVYNIHIRVYVSPAK